MASIEKRTDATGATSYRVKVRLKGATTQTATFERLTDARKWAQSIESAIREGRHFKTAEAKRHTVKDLIGKYLDEVMPHKSASMQANQWGELAWWQTQLGHLLLADLTSAKINEARQTLLKEPLLPATNNPAKQGPARYRSPATCNRYLAALSHVLTVATNQWEWLETNPIAKVSRGTESRGRVRYLSDEVRAALLEACRLSGTPELYPAVMLALSTGARQQEIMGLRWPQVDLRNGWIYLEHTKNKERRTLPLRGQALALVKALPRRIDTPLLVPWATAQRQAYRP